jgi:hypothetical protein
LLGELFSICAINFMYFNLNKGVNAHILYKNISIHNSISNSITTYPSLENALFSLNIISFVSLTVLICLIILVKSKFKENSTPEYYLSKISTIYI